MRKLVVIATDHYVRNLVRAGSFDAIEDADTSYVVSEKVRDLEPLEAKPGFLGSVPEPRRRVRPYAHLQRLLLAAYRRRSSTLRTKHRLMPWTQRLRYAVLSLPGLRALMVRWYLWRAGGNEKLEQLIDEVRPDLVIAPSGGIDPLVTDTLRAARKAGVPTLVLVHNWDNLSSKGAFAVRPDHLGVWGPQSKEQAERIHEITRETVTSLGAPSFESYFRHVPGSTERPFPFPYALFAGCFAPFDERAALERLERVIEENDLDLKVVYRPHPHRKPRRVPDLIDEQDFEHVLIDPQVRDLYLASSVEYEPGTKRLKPLFPALDYYPALFEHAEFVVCPLSTMIVEAAIFERRVAVIAYDDGVHPDNPAVVFTYDHFEGMDRIDGFRVCHSPAELDSAFLALARGEGLPSEPLREQIRWWLHHDERSYAERLADLVDKIADERGLAQPRVPAASGEAR